MKTIIPRVSLSLLICGASMLSAVAASSSTTTNPFSTSDQWQWDPDRNGIDISSAWSAYGTGTGVTIGILDEWLDYSVLDLEANYSASLSRDFVASEEIDDPAAAYEDEEHGTMVAGMAAGAGVDSIYGAAPSATLVGLHTDLSNDTLLSAFVYGAGLTTNSDGNYVYSTDPVVKIMNCSWGDTSDLYSSSQSTSTFSDIVTAASQNNMIIVFAAGNSRGYSVGKHDYNTGLTGQLAGTSESQLTEAIFVGATNSSGTYAKFSSYGSMLFCVAPGEDVYTTRRDSSTSTGDISEETDDDDDSSTSSLATVNQPTSGTSFAAPIVSGVLALGAQVNPVMDYRWAKYALVNSCIVLDTMYKDLDGNDYTGWVTNMAGHKFSNDYGFGMVNPSGFVSSVLNYAYETIPESHSETLSKANVIKNGTSASTIQTFTVSSKTAGTYYGSTLEDIQVTVDMANINVIGKSGYEGLTITLTHTYGNVSTTSTLISPTTNAETTADSYDTFNWTFTTNAFWGEIVDGTWTLKFSWKDDTGTLSSVAVNDSEIVFNVGEIVTESNVQAKLNALEDGESLRVQSFVWDGLASDVRMRGTQILSVQDTLLMNAGTLYVLDNAQINYANDTNQISKGGVAIILNGGSLYLDGEGVSVTAGRGVTIYSGTLTLNEGTLAGEVTMNGGNVSVNGKQDCTISVNGITMNAGTLAITTSATDLTSSSWSLGNVVMNGGLTTIKQANIDSNFTVYGGEFRVLNSGNYYSKVSSIDVTANPATWATKVHIVITATKTSSSGIVSDVIDPKTKAAKIYVDNVYTLNASDSTLTGQAAIDALVAELQESLIAELDEADEKGYTYVVSTSTVYNEKTSSSSGTVGQIVLEKGATFSSDLTLTGGSGTSTFGTDLVDADGNEILDIYTPVMIVNGGDTEETVTKLDGTLTMKMAEMISDGYASFSRAIEASDYSSITLSGTQTTSGGITIRSDSTLNLLAGTTVNLATSKINIVNGSLATAGAVTLNSTKSSTNTSISTDPNVANVLVFDGGTYYYTVGNTITVQTDYKATERKVYDDDGNVVGSEYVLPYATVIGEDGVSTSQVAGKAVVFDGTTIAMNISFSTGVLPQSTMPFLTILARAGDVVTDAITFSEDSAVVVEGTPPQVYVGDLPGATSDYEDLWYKLDVDTGSFVSGNDVEIDPVRLVYGEYTSEQKTIAYAISKYIGTDVSQELIAEINKSTLVSEVLSAYDQLLPVNLKTIATLHNKQANAVVGTIERRSRELRCGAPVADIWANPLFSSSGFSYTIDPHLLASTSFRQFDLTNYTTPFLAWINGGHTFSDGKKVKHTGKTETKLSNASIGFDYGVTDTLSLGVFVGYLDGETELKNTGSTTEVQVRNIGVYAAGSTTDDIGSTYYTAMLSYGMAEYDFKRNTRIGDYSSTATADPDGTQVIAFISAGYEWDAGSHALTYQWTTGPSISLRYTYNSVDGYRENGNGIDALKTDDFDYSSLLLQIAWRTTARFDIPAFCTIVPELRLTYSHEFIDSDADIDTSFVALPTAKYTTTMNHEGQDYFTIGIGNTFMITQGFTVTVDYDCTLGREDSEPEHSINVMARCRF